MSYLVDTNGWIGFLEGDPKFGTEARFRMVDSPGECLISIASVWEAAIKTGLGKLKLPYDLEHDLPRIFEENGFAVMGLDFREVVAVRDLPKIHGDPFDRIMVAQARKRRMEVISADPVFEDYGLCRIW